MDRPSLDGGITVPFWFERGHILIEASLEGRPSQVFILDTGASSTISRQAAEGLSQQPSGLVNVIGFGPDMKRARQLQVDKFAIGPALLRHKTMLVMDLPRAIVNRGTQPPIAGLIGMDVLGEYVLRIDYGNETLRLIPRTGFRPPASAASLPLILVLNGKGFSLPLVEAEIDGVRGRFIIDTGNAGPVILSDRFSDRLGMFDRDDAPVQAASIGGIGGRVQVNTGHGRMLKLGKINIPNPLLASSANPRLTGYQNMLFGDGSLGNAVLGSFVVTMDYERGRVYLEPVEKIQKTSQAGEGFRLSP